MDERFLRVARTLALLTPLAGCGAEPPPPPATPPPPIARKPSDEGDKPSIVQSDPTEGSGKCRCSWDNNANAAPRVCKKGELAYNGGVCVAGSRPKYPIAIGPLPPPDLPA
jgi:hypothetical protein